MIKRFKTDGASYYKIKRNIVKLNLNINLNEYLNYLVKEKCIKKKRNKYCYLQNKINPNLDFTDINELIETAEFCTQLPVHQRHPYAGSLVHTAFSGSHQDAIRKGMEAISKANNEKWEVPYLPIDPSDIGKTYEAIIRVNSQSGKAGSAWLLEQDHNIYLPRGAQVQFSKSVQKFNFWTSGTFMLVSQRARRNKKKKTFRCKQKNG